MPKQDIDIVAKAAKGLGARIVIVHGETPVEPVEPGTNEAAVSSRWVDVLAHPGIVSLEDARVAAEKGVFLEISARKGHSLANGHVVRMAQQSGALTVLDSDAHQPEDLLTPEIREKVALGAGLSHRELDSLFRRKPQEPPGKARGASDHGVQIELQALMPDQPAFPVRNTFLLHTPQVLWAAAAPLPLGKFYRSRR